MVVATNSRLQVRGFYAALLISIGIAAGFWLAYLGKHMIGLAAIIAALASLLAVFIVGRKKQDKERDSKR